jgi:hypothetical protein
MGGQGAKTIKKGVLSTCLAFLFVYMDLISFFFGEGSVYMHGAT